MSKKICVYIIANTVSGKKYVGRAVNPDARFEKHISALKNGRHIVEMMQDESFMFGIETFKLIKFGSYYEDEASRMEVFLMKILRTQDERFGYNYKDRSGICKNAIKDKWRTPPRAWLPAFRAKYLNGETRWRVNRLPYHE